MSMSICVVCARWFAESLMELGQCLSRLCVVASGLSWDLAPGQSAIENLDDNEGQLSPEVIQKSHV
jgi:hypothetical protein